MNVLILGSGGREHAFAWKISQSKLLNKLYLAPGNAGTETIAENVDLNPQNFESVGDFAISKNIDLIIVGPEAPLVSGVYDFFKNKAKLKHISILGPNKEGAQLEGSKDFSKKFMEKYGIPTAAAKTFNMANLSESAAFLEQLSSPYVLKADGLAAGKGVLIIDDLAIAKKELHEMIASKKFGEASAKVLVEEFLDGIELSVFVLTDGKRYTILPEAKDYKRIWDGDKGLNTGGMGAVSPVPFADRAFMDKVEKQVVIPTLFGLEKEDIDYRGFIFIGLMKVGENPFVIEYNVRMGDPETEVVIPRIKSDLLPFLKGAADGNLPDEKLEITSETAITVMHVSGGYPEAYETGKKINIDHILPHTLVFHAGTKMNNNQLESCGGRVITCTAIGKSITDCRKLAYQTSEGIVFEKGFYRKDIGLDLL